MAGIEDQANGSPQGVRPIGWRPQRGPDPVVRPHERTHLPTPLKKGQVFAKRQTGVGTVHGKALAIGLEAAIYPSLPCSHTPGVAGGIVANRSLARWPPQMPQLPRICGQPYRERLSGLILDSQAPRSASGKPACDKEPAVKETWSPQPPKRNSSNPLSASESGTCCWPQPQWSRGLRRE